MTELRPEQAADQSASSFRVTVSARSMDRAGTSVELAKIDGQGMAEVFQDLESGSRTFIALTNEAIPLQAIEWLLLHVHSATDT